MMKKKFYTFMALAIVFLVVFSLSACVGIQPGGEAEDHWVVTWASAQQATEPQNLPPAPGLKDTTLRQIIHTSIGGEQIRFKFSNAFSSSPVVMDSVHVAMSLGRGSIDEESDRELTFQGMTSGGMTSGGMTSGGMTSGGMTSTSIPPREEIYSDPLELSLPPMSDLAVSIYFTEINSRSITGHPGSRTTSYIQEGNALSEPDLPEAARVVHWYILAGLEVMASGSSATLVIAGNSITDGRGSTTDQNDRWPDALVRRMQENEETANIGVYNAGIGGNSVLAGGLGPTLLQRLERDVLNQGGVRWLIVIEGVNDIGSAKGKGPEKAEAVKNNLIKAYKEIISKAHKASIRVFGATITPFGYSSYSSPETENARQAVNDWIRKSKKFDGVIDMDLATRDPEKPSRLKSSADSGDHLHLNPAGYKMMAEAVDLKLFSK